MAYVLQAAQQGAGRETHRPHHPPRYENKGKESFPTLSLHTSHKEKKRACRVCHLGRAEGDM